MHLTSAGGQRNATWSLCQLENVYCLTNQGKQEPLDHVRDIGQRRHLAGTQTGNQRRGAHRDSTRCGPGLLFRRRDDASRWSLALISGMKGTPKQPDPSRPGIHIPIKMQMIGPEHLEEPVAVEATPREAVIPRRFRITTHMLAADGYSAGCMQEENCRSHSRRQF